MENPRKILLRLGTAILALFCAVAAVVWLIDPFYQYHAPFWGLRPVFNDRDNQMPGSVRNLKYDSVLIGSSVAENFDTDYLDAQYGCHTLKVIKSSGSLPDLLYYLEMAQQEHTLQYVFWCLDLFAVDAGTEVELFEQGAPRYLHTVSPFDDLPYVFNKEILLEKIPAWIVSSVQGVNTGGDAYNWADGKEFSAQKAMSAYEREWIDENTIRSKEAGSYQPVTDSNLDRLKEQVRQHPDTQYIFMLPPYSMLWWDCAYVNGELDGRLYIAGQIVSQLAAYENVEIYCFQDQEWIVCDLDNYMDMVHYSPAVNQYMLERLGQRECRILSGEESALVARLESMTHRIFSEEMQKYYRFATE